jgi:hypothetical protein
MQKSLLAVCLLLFTSLALQAQEDVPGKRGGFDRDRLFFGGNFGMAFGSSTTQISISPQIGYRFNQYLAAGAGVNFLYSSFKYYAGGGEYKESYTVAGLNIFGRVYPIEYIFLQLQPELNYTWGKRKYYFDNLPDDKLDGKVVPSLLGGAGAAIPAGGGAFIVMVQYDLLDQERSPYGGRAFYSFGYNIGF